MIIDNVFDFIKYSETYCDISNELKKREELLNHYKQFGIKENRLCFKRNYNYEYNICEHILKNYYNTNDTYDECSPSRPVPVLQIHGLIDLVVPYSGNSFSKSIPEVIDYWVNYNSCNTEPNRSIKTSNDSDLIIYDTYENCLNNINVKSILHPVMDHTWPTLQEYGVSASNEIWDFVSKYDLYGLVD